MTRVCAVSEAKDEYKATRSPGTTHEEHWDKEAATRPKKTFPIPDEDFGDGASGRARSRQASTSTRRPEGHGQLPRCPSQRRWATAHSATTGGAEAKSRIADERCDARGRGAGALSVCIRAVVLWCCARCGVRIQMC